MARNVPYSKHLPLSDLLYPITHPPKMARGAFTSGIRAGHEATVLLGKINAAAGQQRQHGQLQLSEHQRLRQDINPIYAAGPAGAPASSLSRPSPSPIGRLEG